MGLRPYIDGRGKEWGEEACRSSASVLQNCQLYRYNVITVFRNNDYNVKLKEGHLSPKLLVPSQFG